MAGNHRLTINVSGTPAVRDKMYVPFTVQQFMMELLQVNAERTEYFKTCLTCSHFNQETEICDLANSRPPAKVIANACPSYNDMDDPDIPF